MRLFGHTVRRWVLTFIILLVAAPRCAAASDTEVYSVETVPNVRLMDTLMHVSDPMALLSAQARDTINTLFADLERVNGVEVAVVVLPSIGDAEAFDFAHKLFRHWGVGDKASNDGLLVLYVEDQHAIRFVTGYGLEGTLTDALCKRIQTRFMVPAFKRGDRDGGMVSGAKALYSVLKSKSDGGSRKTDNANNYEYVPILLILLVLLVLFMTGVISLHRRCPKCGKRAMKTLSVDHFVSNGIHYRKEVAVCEKCGHVDVRNIKEDGNRNDNDTSSLLTGFMLGSLLGGGRHGGGGGGFSGGSFGGGDSGGGGAGSSW